MSETNSIDATIDNDYIHVRIIENATEDSLLELEVR